MAGIGVERNISNYAKLRKLFFQRSDNTRHQPVGVIRFFRTRRFERCINHRKQRQRGHTKVHRPLSGFQQTIQTLPFNTGHRSHRFNAIGTIKHKHRVDKIIRRQYRLAHQAT